MPVRHPTLEEWFLAYQLDRVKRDHFHLTLDMEADVTRLVQDHADAGARLPVTAVLVKAMALLAREQPEVNRVVFRTLLGMRILEPSYVAVNVPVVLADGTGEHLSGTVVQEPGGMALAEIRDELRAARMRPIADLRIGRLVYGQPNTWWRRLRLRLLHDALQGLPSVYERAGAGALAVTTTMGRAPAGTLVGFGPTALTLGCCHQEEAEGRSLLRLGLAWDHAALSGVQATRAGQRLSEILRGADPAYRAALGPGR